MVWLLKKYGKLSNCYQSYSYLSYWLLIFLIYQNNGGDGLANSKLLTCCVFQSGIMSWLCANIHSEGCENLFISTALFCTHCSTGLFWLFVQSIVMWLSHNFNISLSLLWKAILIISPVCVYMVVTNSSNTGLWVHLEWFLNVKTLIDRTMFHLSLGILHRLQYKLPFTRHQ